ncbi:unnamed protein product [Symbiodinium sp. CCMP2592]|nr:unnamed protein product [Symbiodinium sp. CCMP2592]
MSAKQQRPEQDLGSLELEPWEDSSLVNASLNLTPSPSPPKKSSTDMERFVEIVLKALDPAEACAMKDLVRQVLQGKRLKMITLCSGTDAAVTTLEVVLQMAVIVFGPPGPLPLLPTADGCSIQGFNKDVIDHVLSCDNEMADSIVQDARGKGCFMSRRNPKRSKTCVADRTGATGETFAQFHEYLRVARPVHFYGEMVVGLMDKEQVYDEDGHMIERSNHESCVYGLRKIGYEITWLVVNPADHKLPHRRPRIHFQGLDARVVTDARRHIERLHGVWSTLASIPVHFKLQDYLLTDEEVKQTSVYAALGQAPIKSGGHAEPKFRKIHQEMCDRNQAGFRLGKIGGCGSQGKGAALVAR